MKSILTAVGNTPMVRLVRLNGDAGGCVYAKVEARNPGGSTKDRVALAMVLDAERRGVLAPGGTIVEPTSGNTGIGLALVAAVRGYRVILTMPDTMSVERRRLLASYGAELVLTPGSGGMQASVERALELVRDTPGAFMPQQFENPANPQAHYETTGPEIWRDMAQRVDAFVAGVGTGGTITGAGRFLREQNPDVKLFAVEPAESPLLSQGKAGPHKIQGIGANFVPKVLDRTFIDEVVAVPGDVAISTARLAATREGLLVGISSGAALAAALQIARREEFAGRNIVALLPDSGERYSW